MRVEKLTFCANCWKIFIQLYCELGNLTQRNGVLNDNLCKEYYLIKKFCKKKKNNVNFQSVKKFCTFFFSFVITTGGRYNLNKLYQSTHTARYSVVKIVKTRSALFNHRSLSFTGGLILNSCRIAHNAHNALLTAAQIQNSKVPKLDLIWPY